MAFIAAAATSIFAGLGVSAGVAGLLGSVSAIAIEVGLSYAVQSLLTPPKQPFSTQVAMQTGGVVPRSFLFGSGASTMGSLVYHGATAAGGKTPNAFYCRVVAISDLPKVRLSGLIVNGASVTYDPDASPAAGDFGIPIPEFRDGDTDCLWISFSDGTATAPDPFMQRWFGDDENYPYTDDMIGVGVAFVRIVARINQKLFTSQPTFTFVADGIPLYDLRDDSSVGGDGAQRWNSPATWEPRGDPATVVYNIIRGITYNGEWFYGGQNLAASQLPFDMAVAAANECDIDIPLAAGGTEKQFRVSGEIQVSSQPADAIAALLTCSNGRIAEIGGAYKYVLGGPTAPVLSFTDDDIIVTEDQEFDPFPSLDGTINGVTAQYPDPTQGYQLVDAPPLYRGDLEDEDRGRRLPVALTFSFVTSNPTVQRLMQGAVEDARRFRRHQQVMPPSCYVLEPLDCVSWTSAREGYDAKGFRIDAVTDGDNCDQAWRITETEPSDFDWDPDTDERPYSSGVLVIQRTPAQPMSGWGASGVAIEGDGGRAKAAIHMTWDTDVDDVGGILYEVRRASDQVLVTAGQTDRWDLGYGDIDQNIVGLTDYEVRGRYRPVSARDTDWSDWIAATTPKVTVTADDLSDPVNALLQQLMSDTQAALKPIIDALDAKVDGLAQNTAGIATVINQYIENSIINYIGVQFGNAYAKALQGATVSAQNKAVLAAIFGDVIASLGASTAETLYQYVTSVNEDGTLATITQRARASTDVAFSEAGLTITAAVGEDGTPASATTLSGDRVYIEKSDGSYLLNLLDLAIVDVPVDTPIDDDGNIQADLTTLQRNFTTTLTDDATYVAPIADKPGPAFIHLLQQGTGGGSLVTFDRDEIVGNIPEVDAAPNAINVMEGRIFSIAPVRYLFEQKDVLLLDEPDPFSLISQANKTASTATGTAWQSGAFVPTGIADPGDVVIACQLVQVTAAPTVPLAPAPDWETATYFPVTQVTTGVFIGMAIYYKRITSADNTSIYPYTVQTIVLRGGGILKLIDGPTLAEFVQAATVGTIGASFGVAPMAIVAFGANVALPGESGAISTSTPSAWTTGSFDGDVALTDRNGYNAGTNLSCNSRVGVKLLTSPPADFTVAQGYIGGGTMQFLLGMALQGSVSR